MDATKCPATGGVVKDGRQITIGEQGLVDHCPCCPGQVTIHQHISLTREEEEHLAERVGIRLLHKLQRAKG